mgnify:CR=1 FL=1
MMMSPFSKRFTTDEPVTSDGVNITLRVNVDIPEEAEAAASSGALGVGLMRNVATSATPGASTAPPTAATR